MQNNDDLTTSRRRYTPETVKRFLISEELFIFASFKKKISKILNPLSIAVRVSLLADLAIQDIIRLNDKDQIVLTSNHLKQMPLEPLTTMISIISQCQITIPRFIKLTNGEIFNKSHFFIRKVRKRILESLQKRSILQFKSGINYNIKVTNEVRESCIQRISEYIRNDENADINWEVLLLALEYSNILPDLLICLDISVQKKIMFKINQIKKKVSQKTYAEKDEAVYMCLEYFIKDK